MHDPADGNPFFNSGATLGYVGSYILSQLPGGFNTGVPYGWDVWVVSPEGGVGVALETRNVSFSSLGGAGAMSELAVSSFERPRWEDRPSLP